MAALAPLVGPEACRLVTARSRPTVLLHGPSTVEGGGGGLVEAAAGRVRAGMLCFFGLPQRFAMELEIPRN